jgi:hypothetical protein
MTICTYYLACSLRACAALCLFCHLNLQEAIDSARLAWISAHEPENFNDFIEARGSMASTETDWVDNKSSDHCMLCVDKFTYSNRRHHCRCCGTLCCAPCSTKRLRLQYDPRASVGSSSSGKGFQGDRVCDGCFNKLSSEAMARNAAMAKAKKELLLQLERDEKQGLLNGANSSLSMSGKVNRSESGGALSGHGDQIDDLKEVRDSSFFTSLS